MGSVAALDRIFRPSPFSPYILKHRRGIDSKAHPLKTLQLVYKLEPSSSEIQIQRGINKFYVALVRDAKYSHAAVVRGKTLQ